MSSSRSVLVAFVIGNCRLFDKLEMHTYRLLEIASHVTQKQQLHKTTDARSNASRIFELLNRKLQFYICSKKGKKINENENNYNNLSKNGQIDCYRKDKWTDKHL